MPYSIIQNKDKSFMVINKDNHSIKSFHTTLEKAKRQVNFLHMIDNNKLSYNKIISHKDKKK